MLKKLLAAVSLAAIVFASAQQVQAAQYVQTWSNSFSVAVPVNCSFTIPTTANSWTSSGNSQPNSQYGQYTLALAQGGCNVDYAMSFGFKNPGGVTANGTIGSTNGCNGSGVLVSQNNRTLPYSFSSTSCGGTSTQPISPTLTMLINAGNNAYGGDTYQDIITMSITY